MTRESIEIMEFATNITGYAKDKEKLTKKDHFFLFDAIASFLAIAVPHGFYRHLVHPQIINELLRYLYMLPGLSRENRFALSDLLNPLEKKLAYDKSDYYYQFRLLGSNGFYPDITLRQKNVLYACRQLRPILVTYNKYEAEEKFSNDSEITIMTRHELKFATSLICASNGLDHVYFNSFETIQLDADVLSPVPEYLHMDIFMELLEYKRRFHRRSHYGSEIEDGPTLGHLFIPFSDYLQQFTKISAKYSIRDHLLMRTSNHLFKAIMFWDNRIFSEDAIGHTLIALEGCLHLLQRKWGNNTGRIDLKLLKSGFENHIDKSGQLFDFIKEAYRKRISLIHPEPDWGSEWTPFLMAEDFYDYFKISRDLMFYYLTDTKKGTLADY